MATKTEKQIRANLKRVVEICNKIELQNQDLGLDLAAATECFCEATGVPLESARTIFKRKREEIEQRNQ